MHPILQSRTRNAEYDTNGFHVCGMTSWPILSSLSLERCYLGTRKWNILRKFFYINVCTLYIHILYNIYIFPTHILHGEIKIKMSDVLFCPQLVLSEYMSACGSLGQGWSGQDNVRFGGEMLQR